MELESGVRVSRGPRLGWMDDERKDQDRSQPGWEVGRTGRYIIRLFEGKADIEIEEWEKKENQGD